MLNPIVVQLVWDADCIQCKLPVCTRVGLQLYASLQHIEYIEFHQVTMSLITVKALDCMNSSGLRVTFVKKKKMWHSAIKCT